MKEMDFLVFGLGYLLNLIKKYRAFSSTSSYLLEVRKMETDPAATRSLKAKQSNREITSVSFILLTQ